MSLRVLSIQPLLTPFQVEVAKFANQHTGWDYGVVFLRARSSHRGEHWVEGSQLQDASINVAPEGSKTDTIDWSVRMARRFAPDVVLCHGVRGSVPRSKECNV